jgi:hypothetical protein
MKKVLATITVCLVSGIGSCRHERTNGSKAANPTERETVKSSESQRGDTSVRHSTEVLPESQSLLERKVRTGDTPITIAHATPPLENDAQGPYSYLGAAREFETICGIAMPGWVEPVAGDYSVSRQGKHFLAWSRLTYRIDPSRCNELIQSINDGYKRIRGSAPHWFRVGDPTTGPSGVQMGEKLLDGIIRVYDIKIQIVDDGTIKLFNIRGPDDSDNG